MDVPLIIALPLGLLLLLISYASLTYVEQQPTLKYVRLLIGLPTFYLLAQSLFPRESWAQNGNAYAAYFTFAVIAIEMSVETCFLRFWDRSEDVPRWIELRKDLLRDPGKKDQLPGRILLPLPQTAHGRMLYAVDSLTGLRGASWLQNRAWDWAPPQIYAYQGEPGYGRFFKRSVWNAVGQYVAFDIALTVVSARSWDLQRPNPVSSAMHLPQQMVFSAFAGLTSYYGAALTWTLASCIFVQVFRWRPENLAPFWNEPQKSKSLAEFWSFRWHTMMQRQWVRLSSPIIALVRPYCSPKTLKFTLTVLVFIQSAIFHAANAYGMPPDEHIKRPVPDVGSLKFFLSQPLGLLLEDQIVKPLTRRVSEPYRVWARRAFVWTWLMWSGRWYADEFVLRGLFDQKLHGYRPMLGLLSALGIAHRWIP